MPPKMTRVMPIAPAVPISAPGGNIIFLIGRGGGGHKASAQALFACLMEQGIPWADKIQFVDVGYLIDSFVKGALTARTSGFDGDEMYNCLMRRGHYRLASLMGLMAILGARLMHGRIMKGLRRYWQDQQPCLVCSFVPYLNAQFRESLLQAGSSAMLFTVVTDFETDNRAHLWVPRWDPVFGKRHIVVAGTTYLQQQCRDLGYPPEHVLNTSGMVLHPAFCRDRDPNEVDAAAKERPLRALIFFGGFAPHNVYDLVRLLRSSHPEMEIGVLCGGNTELCRRLESSGMCCLVEGLVTPKCVAEHMRACTLLIGKPGPGTVSEAAACHVPFVTQRRHVMAQERSVLRWIEANNIGLVVNRWSRLPPAPELTTCVHMCATKLASLPPNRACFEVVEACRQHIMQKV